MKCYRLITHQKNFSGKWKQYMEMYQSNTLSMRMLNRCVVCCRFIDLVLAEDLLLNPKDHPDAKIGDVVEIYQPEDEGVRLLLQITSFHEDRNRAKGTAPSDSLH